MSKKAKKVKAARKRRATALDAARNEARNYQSLAEQHQTLHAGAEMKLAEVSKELAETKSRLTARFDDNMNLRSSINTLKSLVADLERSVAERDGEIRALRNQIDQAAPKVEVMPAVMVSPREAQQMRQTHSTAGDMDTVALRRALGGESSRTKHWSSL